MYGDALKCPAKQARKIGSGPESGTQMAWLSAAIHADYVYRALGSFSLPALLSWKKEIHADREIFGV